MTACSAAWAQQEPSFAHYWAMEPSFNPAAAGKDPVLNVAGAYDMTLVGFEHNPKTMYVGGDMQLFFLGAYHGVGLQLMNDDIGLFSHQRLAVQYAYKHKLLGGTISIGVQAGMLSESFDGSGVDLEVDTDDAFVKSELSFPIAFAHSGKNNLVGRESGLEYLFYLAT